MERSRYIAHEKFEGLSPVFVDAQVEGAEDFSQGHHGESRDRTRAQGLAAQGSGGLTLFQGMNHRLWSSLASQTRKSVLVRNRRLGSSEMHAGIGSVGRE
jgi:hypothetical protein